MLMAFIFAAIAETPSPRFSGERVGAYCAAMGRVRGLPIAIHKPLIPPTASRWAPPFSPLKRGEGCEVSC
jgi:hypothetical protein